MTPRPVNAHPCRHRSRLSRRVLLVLSLLALTGVMVAQTSTSPAEKGILSYRLSNGIMLLAQPRYDITYARASIYLPIPEPLRTRSLELSRTLARLYLDTAPEGQETPRQIMATLDTQVNITRDGPYVAFHLHCLEESLPRAVGTLLDIIAQNRFASPYEEQARQLIRHQQEESEAIGWSVLAPEVEESLLAGRSLSVAVQPNAPLGINPDTLHAAWPLFLDPTRIRLVLSGRGDVAETARVVSEHTQKWKPPKEEVHLDATPAPPTGVDFVEWRHPVSTHRIVIYLTGPGERAADLPAFLVACSTLADGMTSVLGRGFLTPDKMVPALLESRFRLTGNRSLFTVEIACPLSSFDTAELNFFTAAEMVRRGKLLAIDPDRGRNQAFVHAARTLESFDRFHWQLLRTGRPITNAFFTHWRTRLQKVSTKAIQAACARYITLDRAVVLELTGSAGEPRGFTADTFRESMRSLLPLAIRDRLEAFKNIPDIPLALPKADPLPQAGLEYREEVVSSGILRGPDVLLAERYFEPLVWMDIYYPGGRLVEPAKWTGINRLALLQRFLTIRDTQKRLLLDQFEMLGGRFTIVEGLEYSGVRLLFPAYFRKPITGLAFEILHRRQPAEKDIQATLPWARVWDDDDQLPPAEDVLRQAFAGLYGTGTAFTRMIDGLREVTAADVTTHYDRHFYRILPSVAILGCFQGTDLLPEIAESAAGSSFGELKLAPVQMVFPHGKVTESQSSGRQLVDIAFPGPYAGDPDLLRLEVLKWLYFGPQHQAGPAGETWFTILPLMSRGSIHLRFFDPGSDTPATIQATLKWLKELGSGAINSWNLATAIKMAELEEARRSTIPDEQVRWMALNAMWKSNLWKDNVRTEAIHNISKARLKDMINRYFALGKYAVAAVDAPSAAVATPSETAPTPPEEKKAQPPSIPTASSSK